MRDGINDTVQFRDMCRLLHNFPLSLSNPSTLNISNKVRTVLHFFAAGRHLKRSQISEFVIGTPVTSKGSFLFTAFLSGVLHP